VNRTIPASDSTCTLCTRQLEELCFERAWWFRALRGVLAVGVGLFAVALRVRVDDGTRAPMCTGCLRFRKNAVKRRSPFFCRLDAIVNPLFNRARDALLSTEERDRARVLARRAEHRAFARPRDLSTLSAAAPAPSPAPETAACAGARA
jgi:hypothetical protein